MSPIRRNPKSSRDPDPDPDPVIIENMCYAGVMCLDFHPQHAHLLAVGCYDGSVLVYDLRSKVRLYSVNGAPALSSRNTFLGREVPDVCQALSVPGPCTDTKPACRCTCLILCTML